VADDSGLEIMALESWHRLLVRLLVVALQLLQLPADGWEEGD
jgi:hypothetical protein